jgi:hypothetical protein
MVVPLENQTCAKRIESASVGRYIRMKDWISMHGIRVITFASEEINISPCILELVNL